MSRTASASSSRPPPPKSAELNGKAAARDDVIRTKILLLGMRRSGKTSIRQVLFNNLSERETLYLETTTHLTKQPFDTVIPLEIWDCPGDTTLETLDAPLTQFATMIFVIDIQDLYHQPIQKLVDFVITAYKENPNMNLEVFVHKADVLTEEYKIENFRDIQQRVISELTYINVEYEQIPINFQLTSILDHSLHDAFSRVLHKLIDSLPYLEDLLNVFCANSQASKAFLFDTVSRLYVATDASPVDPPTHNLCSDYLQTLNAFGPLYKSVSASPLRMRVDPAGLSTSVAPSAPTSPPTSPSLPPTSAQPSASTLQLPPPPSPSPDTSATKSPPPINTILSAPITTSPSAITPPTLPASAGGAGTGTGTPAASSATTPDPASGSTSATPDTTAASPAPRQRQHPRFYPSAAASLAPTAAGGAVVGAGGGGGAGAAAAAAGGGTTLTYHLITPQLALLALVPSTVFAARRGLLEYNVVFFREGVQEICDVEAEARRVK
ncbi:Gtr1/RagA G protein conserved region-domain-containing protein [Trametes punicea]|nr:Gtr1/RagA G protein conserved region-domain-containing protein [Trametes punicea]